MMARNLVVSVAAALVLAACGGGGETEQQPPAAAPAAAAPAQTPAATPAALPAGVTAAMVTEGNQLYHSTGICFTCHGQNGVGVQGLGPNLADATWLHSDGSYDAIVGQITKGVPANVSTTGVMMPAKGGANLSDAQIKAIGAYVYSLRGM
ncbi:MAG: cytochrome c [Gemmatimonadota bacterium]|nr:cytochrome c [Gemmatimonadota bacterium]